jgi:hypothetical protein
VNERRFAIPELFLGLLAIGVAFVLVAHIIGGTVRDVRHTRDTLSVTASARVPISANLVSWSLTVSAESSTTAPAARRLRRNSARVRKFLLGGGIPADEITPSVVESGQIVIRLPPRRRLVRYRVAQELEVRTKQIDVVEAAATRVGTLLEEGITVSADPLAYDLELGRHDRVVADLEALVSEEPLRERPRRQLMLALYRSGRRADALACYVDARRRLVDELGLEPGAALRELERAILREDPALDGGGTRPAPVRGPVLVTSPVLLDLLLPLCADGRELLLIDVVRAGEELRAPAIPHVRTAAFTSTAPAVDLGLVAAEQEAELLVVTDPSFVPAAPACDVALASERRPGPPAPVVAPFGGRSDEWAALELAAWLARARGVPLRLLGTEARSGQRDASRMLASASLALQRFTNVEAETALVPAGPDGVLAQESCAVVASLPAGELGASRARLLAEAAVPVLLVRGGLRPSGVAPEQSLTRFTWSLGELQR